MPKYQSFATDTFKKIYNSLDKGEQDWIQKIKLSLQESITGDILRYSWFREKKYQNKRLYFIVDENTKRILLLSFASKKDQQKIIDNIIEDMKGLLKYLRGL